MRLSALAGVLVLTVPGCARLNPAFGFEEGETDSGSGGVTSAATGASSGPGSTTSGGTAEGSGEGGSTSGTDETGDDPALCGNGQLDGDEACDDGNVENGDSCLDDCTLVPTPDWVYLPPLEMGVPARFKAVAVRNDVVVAVGRAADTAVSDHAMLLVSLWRDEGDPIDAVLLPWGMGAGAEARSVAIRGSTLYYAGRSNNVGQSSLVGAVALMARGTFDTPSTREIGGTRAQGIGFRGEGVILGSGEFNTMGLGLVACDFRLAACPSSQMLLSDTQLDDLAVAGGTIFGAGVLGGDPVIVETDVPDVADLGTLYAEPGPGRFQGLAVDGDVIFAVGTRDRGMAGEEAWAVAYSLGDGALLWSRSLDTESLFDDEFEDVAVSSEGHAIAVGMLGDPPRPVVFEFDRDDGSTRWETTLEPPGAFESGHARGVAVDDDELFVVGEWRVTADPGDGLGVDSVPFAARFVR